MESLNINIWQKGDELKIKKVEDEDLLELNKLGLLHREIAEILGCNTSTVTNRLHKLGIRKYNMNRRKEVLELHNKGLYDREIAGILNITREDVTHLLNVQGIRGRSKKIDDYKMRKKISQSLIGRFTGKNNPNFKGYRDEKTIARGIFKTISKRLLMECDYTCQNCGKRGGNLETHHIKPFNIILKEFFDKKYSGNIDTFYEEITNYPDFMDESNMVVLCHDCHRRVHYSDNHELNPYRWGSATTIEKMPE